jgi:hypothetical protein
MALPGDSTGSAGLTFDGGIALGAYGGVEVLEITENHDSIFGGSDRCHLTSHFALLCSSVFWQNTDTGSAAGSVNNCPVPIGIAGNGARVARAGTGSTRILCMTR